MVSVSHFDANFCYDKLTDRQDGSVRSTFQTTATNSYATHSLLATVAVIRSVVAAAAQPAYSRVADVFGRIELLVFSVTLYVVGEFCRLYLILSYPDL